MEIKKLAEIKKILLVVDPTKERQEVIPRTIRLAKALGAEVELMVAEYQRALESSYPFDAKALSSAKESCLASRERWLEAFAEQMRAHGIAVTQHVRWEKPLYKAVVERCRETQAQLIIKATHHHSILQRALFTNTDWHLMRDADAPIWFVREEHRWDGHIQVLAAVDPIETEGSINHLNPRILDIAHEISCRLPAELNVVHAYEPIPTGMLVEFDAIVADYEEYREKVKSKHQKALDRLLESYVESSTHVFFEEGSPEKVLPACVNQHGHDLVVMGAVSRSGVDRIFIGSTAERVLDNLECDVLVIK
ncbi:universal stress protein [Hahella sp. NBU794]|uniref:universal stress protein n=1 Tax=Hahella sp. NBU794 TaxID=3422590 RepID=UPI003D6E99C4